MSPSRRLPAWPRRGEGPRRGTVCPPRELIGFRQRHPIFRRLAADQALTARLLLGVDGPDRHTARLGLDSGFAFSVAAPGRPHEATVLLEMRDHLGQRRY